MYLVIKMVKSIGCKYVYATFKQDQLMLNEKPPHDPQFAALMKQLGLLTQQASNLTELRTKALELTGPYINTQGEPTGTSWRYVIDGFVDTEMDEYWEIDDWLRSTEFVQWIVKNHKEHISDQLDKDCVWELLQKNKPSNNANHKDRQFRNSITQKNNLDKP